MSKSTGNKVRVEAWKVATVSTDENPDGRKAVAKVAVRNHLGQFHGATNFKGSVIG